MKEGDIDRYIKESSKSYRGCRVKNSARRNSLQRKTLGIEAERKIAAAGMGREEKQLREQLKQMQIDKMKNSLVHNMRERSKKMNDDISEKDEDELLQIPIEPYPVTLVDSPRSSPEFRSGKTTLEDMGKAYSHRRGRRLSKEFEDLHLNTETGKLQKPQNLAKRLLAGTGRSGCRPTSSSSMKRNFNSQTSLRKSVDSSGDGSSSSAVSSLEDLHWIGAPEATKSVRRPRLTVEEQEFSSEIHKLSKTKKAISSSRSTNKSYREKS